ncbi:MAG: hypothetical protein EBU46_06080 [Nitrosomonadaceae bacterium]|nr:hypothetical protein [Nitrosomonadaceae bacterium]
MPNETQQPTIADLLKRPHNRQGSFDQNHVHWRAFNLLLNTDNLPLSWAQVLVGPNYCSDGVTYLPQGWDDEKMGWQLFRRPNSMLTDGLFIMKAHAITDLLPARYQQCWYVKYYQSWYLLEKMMTESTWRCLRDRPQPSTMYEQ